METTIRDVSFSKLLEDASLIFFEYEKKLPKESFLDNTVVSSYIKTMQLLLYVSAVNNYFSVDSFSQFSIFLSCIVKSTLYFHYCFDHPIKDPNSKLALMFGDLYLVKGGEQLVKIKNFLRLHPSFRELLYSISMSQRIQEESRGIPKENFEKIVSMSYGYIFRFSLIAPFLWVKNNAFEKRKLTQLAKDVSLYLAWQIEPFLSSTLNKEDIISKLLEKIKINLGEENYDRYHIDGWKTDIQKIAGGASSKN